jgi:hypothetical protein
MDDNEEIIDLIKKRIAKGAAEYGHGIRVKDKTTNWGTKIDSWTEMGLEEALDLSIYLAAQILRVMRNEEQRKTIVKGLTERIAELETVKKRYEILHADRLRDETMADPLECTCGGDNGCHGIDANCLNLRFHEQGVCFTDCPWCDFIAQS